VHTKWKEEPEGRQLTNALKKNRRNKAKRLRSSLCLSMYVANKTIWVEIKNKTTFARDGLSRERPKIKVRCNVQLDSQAGEHYRTNNASSSRNKARLKLIISSIRKTNTSILRRRWTKGEKRELTKALEKKVNLKTTTIKLLDNMCCDPYTILSRKYLVFWFKHNRRKCLCYVTCLYYKSSANNSVLSVGKSEMYRVLASSSASHFAKGISEHTWVGWTSGWRNFVIRN